MFSEQYLSPAHSAFPPPAPHLQRHILFNFNIKPHPHSSPSDDPGVKELTSLVVGGYSRWLVRPKARPDVAIVPWLKLFPQRVLFLE